MASVSEMNEMHEKECAYTNRRLDKIDKYLGRVEISKAQIGLKDARAGIGIKQQGVYMNKWGKCNFCKQAIKDQDKPNSNGLGDIHWHGTCRNIIHLVETNNDVRVALRKILDENSKE